MIWPKIVALIITYRRLELALATIRSVKEMVQYPGPIHFHIADDGSGKEYIDRLIAEAGGPGIATYSDSARGGVGHNMNLGIEGALKQSDIWLHLEDDWALANPLDLRPCVELLTKDETVGMVRLGYLSEGIEATSLGGAGKMWWRMKKGSNTYILAGHAALRHKRFVKAYGPYAKGLMPGQTELNYCWAFNTKPGPDIVWPAWIGTEDLFRHIGDHQSFKYYMENEGLSAEAAADKFAKMKP